MPPGASVPVPSVVEPSMNVMVPVGVSPNWPSTSAVNTKGCTAADGLTLDDTKECVVSKMMVWLSGGDVLVTR